MNLVKNSFTGSIISELTPDWNHLTMSRENLVDLNFRSNIMFFANFLWHFDIIDMIICFLVL